MSAVRRGSPARLPVLLSVIALCALGTAAVFPAPGYPSGFAYAFVAAAATRLLAGAGGRPLLPRRVLLALGSAVGAVCGAYLVQRLGARGSDSLWTLMCLVSIFQTLVLTWRQSTFSHFLLILLSSVHAAGIAFARPDNAALAFIAAYVALLAWTLLLFERQAALEEGDADGVERHARAPDTVSLPLAPVLRSSIVLVLFGLPLGALLYLAVPRGLNPWSLPRPADEAPEGPDAAEDPQDARAAAAPRAFSVSGPGGGGGAPLGSVAEIKRNFEPWFEVGLADGSGMPPTVILRDNAQDHYDPKGVWRDTISEEGRAQLHRDIDDGRWDGWIPLAGSGRRDGVTLRVEVLRGGPTRLYLQPDEVALSILRDGAPLARLSVHERLNKTFDASVPLEAGDVILQTYVAPLQDDRLLEGRRSDSRVAPLTSYLQVPERCLGPLRARARAVVGSERDPWRRARRIEAWLRSEAFTYSLKIPPLDPRDPLLDFLERTRTANCEAFAYALTLMLRSLGHPARYVRGFWGGDRQEQRGTVILRGLHYHAWTEMFLEGAGWVPLNPTPPDRIPVDAETLTAAKEAWEEQHAAEDESWSFLGYGSQDWRTFWRGVGARLRDWILQPAAALFTRRSGYVGIPLLLLLLWWMRRRRERTRLRRLVVAPGAALPAGAYGEALLLLARKGVRRPRHQTLREFLRHVTRRLPAAAEPLERLTRAHERVRYAGRPAGEVRGDSADALADLRRALRERSAPPD